MRPNTAQSESKFAPRLLVQGPCKSVLHSPLKNIDITEWIFILGDAEYQQCSISHIACGSSCAALEGVMLRLYEDLLKLFLVEIIRLSALSPVFANYHRLRIYFRW
jgi:hypothetical protein